MSDFDKALISGGLFLAVIIVAGGVLISITQPNRDNAAANRAYAEEQKTEARRDFVIAVIGELGDTLATGSDVVIATLAGVLGVCGAPLALGVLGWLAWKEKKQVKKYTGGNYGNNRT